MKASRVIGILVAWLLGVAPGNAQTTAPSATTPFTPRLSTTPPTTTPPAPTGAPGAVTGAREAVVLTCVFDLRSQPARFVVFDAAGAAVAGIPQGALCADSLSALLGAGFVIASALPSFEGGTQYTFIR